MLLRWVLDVFPRDMRSGWRLLACDLWFWVAAAAALVALAYVEPLVVGAPPTGDAAVTGVVSLLRHLLGPLVFVAAALRFRAAYYERPLSWRDTAAHATRRIFPAALAWLAAAGVCMAGAVVAQVGALLMFRSADEPGDTLGAASMFVRTAVFALLLARFAFVPYLAALHTGRELAPADPYSTPVPRPLYRVIWPLVESSRMTLGMQWRVLPYLLLGLYAPVAAAATPSLLRPLVSVALHLVAFTALAVLFRYYVTRAHELWPERTGAIAPAAA